jgi:hypothetical protein
VTSLVSYIDHELIGHQGLGHWRRWDDCRRRAPPHHSRESRIRQEGCAPGHSRQRRLDLRYQVYLGRLELFAHPTQLYVAGSHFPPVQCRGRSLLLRFPLTVFPSFLRFLLLFALHCIARIYPDLHDLWLFDRDVQGGRISGYMRNRHVFVI